VTLVQPPTLFVVSFSFFSDLTFGLIQGYSVDFTHKFTLFCACFSQQHPLGFKPDLLEPLNDCWVCPICRIATASISYQFISSDHQNESLVCGLSHPVFPSCPDFINPTHNCMQHERVATFQFRSPLRVLDKPTLNCVILRDFLKLIEVFWCLDRIAWTCSMTCFSRASNRRYAHQTFTCGPKPSSHSNNGTDSSQPAHKMCYCWSESRKWGQRRTNDLANTREKFRRGSNETNSSNISERYLNYNSHTRQRESETWNKGVKPFESGRWKHAHDRVNLWVRPTLLAKTSPKRRSEKKEKETTNKFGGWTKVNAAGCARKTQVEQICWYGGGMTPPLCLVRPFLLSGNRLSQRSSSWSIEKFVIHY
jgi:hypothetical protein